jgi:hypothetical protein
MIGTTATNSRRHKSKDASNPSDGARRPFGNVGSGCSSAPAGRCSSTSAAKEDEMREVLGVIAAALLVVCACGGEKARRAEPATAPASAETNTVSVMFSGRVDVEVSCFGDPPRVPVVTDLRFTEPDTQQLTDIAPGFCNIAPHGEGPLRAEPSTCYFTAEPSTCDVQVLATPLHT